MTIEDVVRRDSLFEEQEQLQERIYTLNKYLEANKDSRYEWDDTGHLYDIMVRQLKAMNEYDDLLDYRIEMMKNDEGW